MGCTNLSCDVAWAAGIIEGEGYISPRRGGIYVSMTDEDIIRKLHGIVPGSIVNGPYLAKKRATKPAWRWSIGKGEISLPFAKSILPYMGIRRSKKLAGLIEKLTNRFNFCRKGHEFTEENSYIWKGKRQCRLCRKEASARHERLFRKGKRDYSA